MNRPLKNRNRGAQSGSIPAKPSPAPAMNVANYDGRINYGAGKHVQQFSLDDAQGDGYTVGWRKTVNGK